MPTPDRTSLPQIVAQARDILEADGLPGLTMQAVADRVGVRAPSLYKRVASRDSLIRLVVEQTAKELGIALTAAKPGADADARVEFHDVLQAFRAFAHAHPAAYQLMFAPHGEASAPDPQVLADASAPVLAIATRLAGRDQALPAARTITAWAHGFVTMELTGAFRLGGNVDQAWEFGVAHLTEALSGD
ncbi:TetR/AcrR family transcriptional regulator [Salinibacterium hongtaonis]|uniref:TetR family transcriptional regulator n=1 Tax=Homoserinimonas hongtaonis TaxID=2079791 RepID=A0A2U1SWT9_9MICO|nr:TetR-like C-terminal domain-containing protein [Salinibacterium hongtaonis]PWB96094.1 TetR family transcriptional regulator [Salinibacterium hongtaonis]